MRWAPPFLANCIQAAGIMSILVCECSYSSLLISRDVVYLCHALCALAVRYKPLDTQASVGLTKCINALTGMEVRNSILCTRGCTAHNSGLPYGNTAHVDERTPRPPPHPERPGAHRQHILQSRAALRWYAATTETSCACCVRAGHPPRVCCSAGAPPAVDFLPPFLLSTNATSTPAPASASTPASPGTFSSSGSGAYLSPPRPCPRSRLYPPRLPTRARHLALALSLALGARLRRPSRPPVHIPRRDAHGSRRERVRAVYARIRLVVASARAAARTSNSGSSSAPASVTPAPATTTATATTVDANGSTGGDAGTGAVERVHVWPAAVLAGLHAGDAGPGLALPFGVRPSVLSFSAEVLSSYQDVRVRLSLT